MELLGVFFTLFIILKESSSVTVRLNDYGLREFKTEVTRGDDLTITCRGSPSRRGYVVWRQNWVHLNFDRTVQTVLYDEITQEQHPRFHLRGMGAVMLNMGSGDAGYYICTHIIPGDIPETDSAQYIVNVTGTMSNIYAVFPHNHYIIETMSARFYCGEIKPSGYYIRYTWYKDGYKLPTNAYKGDWKTRQSTYHYDKKTGTLVIPKVNYFDYGVYQCEGNDFLEKRYSRKVNIDRVWFRGKTKCHFPENDMMIVGKNATFTCENVMPNDFPKSIPNVFQWFKDGSLLPTNSKDNDRFRRSNFTFNRTSGTVTFHKVTKHDFGYYYCEKYFTVPKASFYVDCSKKYIGGPAPPGNLTCVFQIRDELFESNRSRRNFTCHETVKAGILPVSYTWYKNDQELPISSASNSNFSDSNFSYNKETGTLTFEGVSAADEGVYRCVAENGAVEVKQCETPYVRLAARPGRAVCEFPEANAMGLGGDYTFRCMESEPTGLPKPQIYWMKGDWLGTTELMKEQSEPNSLNPDWSYTTDRITGTLAFTSVNYSDAGMYSCKIVNFEGESYCKGNIVVTRDSRFVRSGSRSMSPWIIMDSFIGIYAFVFISHTLDVNP